jgi:hypothetical protein
VLAAAMLYERGGLFRAQSAAVLKLGGERGLAQRLPCHGGDAFDVGVVAVRTAGTSWLPCRVRCAEQLGSPVRLAVECLGTG